MNTVSRSTYGLTNGLRMVREMVANERRHQHGATFGMPARVTGPHLLPGPRFAAVVQSGDTRTHIWVDVLTRKV